MLCIVCTINSMQDKEGRISVTDPHLDVAKAALVAPIQQLAPLSPKQLSRATATKPPMIPVPKSSVTPPADCPNESSTVAIESEQLLEVASTAQHHELQLVDDDSEFHDYVNTPWDRPQVCF